MLFAPLRVRCPAFCYRWRVDSFFGVFEGSLVITPETVSDGPAGQGSG